MGWSTSSPVNDFKCKLFDWFDRMDKTVFKMSSQRHNFSPGQDSVWEGKRFHSNNAASGSVAFFKHKVSSTQLKNSGKDRERRTRRVRGERERKGLRGRDKEDGKRRA